jgi:hypothetical protein
MDIQGSRAMIAPLLALIVLAGGASAQTTDWQALRQIPWGSKIKVTLKHKRTFGHCQLQEVVDDWLACTYAALGYRRYAREDVREVALGHHTARTGFAIGALAGAALGAANGTGGPASRVLYAIIGAPVVGGIGAGVGAIVDPFRHGTSVYRSQNSGAIESTSKSQGLGPDKVSDGGIPDGGNHEMR